MVTIIFFLNETLFNLFLFDGPSFLCHNIAKIILIATLWVLYKKVYLEKCFGRTKSIGWFSLGDALWGTENVGIQASVRSFYPFHMHNYCKFEHNLFSKVYISNFSVLFANQTQSCICNSVTCTCIPHCYYMENCVVSTLNPIFSLINL